MSTPALQSVPPQENPARCRPLSAFSSLKHGAAARILYVPGEDPAEFEALVDDAFEQFQPATLMDASLVFDSVHARWILSRRQRAQETLEEKLHRTVGDPATWTNEHYHSVHLCDRYLTSAERSLNRALSNLRAVKKDASQEARWRDLHAIQRQRLALQREKFEAAKAKEERVAAKQRQREHKKQTPPPAPEPSVQAPATFASETSPANTMRC